MGSSYNIKALLNIFIFGLIMNLNLLADVIEDKTINGKVVESEEKNILREQWIEDMHRTEPGLNWRAINLETRAAKYQNKKEKILRLKELGGKALDKALGSSFNVGDLKGKWIEKGSNNQAGRIHIADIDFSRELIYAGSSGGNIWRGTIDGENWTCLNNSMKIKDIAMVKVVKTNEGKNRILVLGRGPARLYYTDDEGITWNTAEGLEKPGKNGRFKRGELIRENGNFLYVMGRYRNDDNQNVAAVFRSTDFGTTFEELFTSETNFGHCDIWAPDNEDGEFYYIDELDLYKVTPNGDKTFINSINADLNSGSINKVLLRGSDIQGDIKLMALLRINTITGSNFYGLSKYDTDWIYHGNIPYNTFEDNSFNISQTKSEVVYFGKVNCYVSLSDAIEFDSINAWQEYYNDPVEKLHADVPSINSFKNPYPEESEEIILICTDGGLYKSYDRGKTVENISLYGLNASQYYGSYTYRPTSDKIFVGAQDQGFQRCLTDSGGVLGFEQTISGDYGHLVSGDGGENLWCCYPGFALLYQNLTENVSPTYKWEFKQGSWRVWIPPIIPDPSNPERAYLASTNSDGGYYIWHLIKNGSYIDAVTLPFNFMDAENGGQISGIATSPINTNYFYAITNSGAFFYSSDEGQTWTNQGQNPGPGSNYLYGSTILPSAKTFGKVYIAGSGYSNSPVFVSMDHGASFTAINDGLPNTMVNKIAMSDDEEYLFAATDVGPYLYVAKENKWYDMESLDSPDQVFWSVEWVEDIKTARFVTYGRGIWDFKVEGPAGVHERQAEVQDVSLKAYPNPAKTFSNINFQLDKQSNVEIKIYDLEGNIADELYKGMLGVGAHSFQWNTSKAIISSGAYTCIINVDGAISYVKISVVK